jgi:RNA polymerase sigma-70 factor (ECF subfamily)
VQFSDETLVEEIRAGSQIAFGLLMKRFDRLVYRVGFQHTRNHDSAMDITQDVFLKVHHKLDAFTGSGSFKAWLMRIAYNESLNWLRKHKHEIHQVELDESNVPKLHAVPERELQQSEFRALIGEELKQLNPRQQLGISLRYFEGMSVKEIASVLDTSEGSVKSILFRGLEKMRNRITPVRRSEYAKL